MGGGGQNRVAHRGKKNQHNKRGEEGKENLLRARINLRDINFPSKGVGNRRPRARTGEKKVQQEGHRDDGEARRRNKGKYIPRGVSQHFIPNTPVKKTRSTKTYGE